jgi:diguanylate cyclase (GGDEF)-like protein
MRPYRGDVTRGEVASSGRAGDPRPATPLPSASRAPMDAIWWLLLLSACIAMLFVAFPGGFENARTLELEVVAGLLVLALLARFVGPHVAEPWGFDCLILLVGALSSLAASQLPENEGQMLIGIGLLAVGVVVAFFRSTVPTMVLTVAILAMWLVAVAYDRTFSSPAIALSLAIIVLGVTWFVSRLVQRLHELALHDSLTGLLNRRGLELLAEPVIAGARRARLPVTIAIIDVDRFKVFNDTRGHLAGDRLLVGVADAWDEAVRDSDLLARFGGDEFVVLLVGATPDEALALHARADTTFRSSRSDGWSDGWTIGIAELGADERLFEAIDRADAELLERKQTQRTMPPQGGGQTGSAVSVTGQPEPRKGSAPKQP